ncbi:tyrosine-protein phosphatase non-receptor type 23-like [Tropilaelaps mercedesae]|uniref:Tyrosine-protein phosphatase non-receptor type 23-like n=1 Tax=Tropilaelaps mercedesae TaxID=418985 RepID=A0A1V9XV21_9ACAR|nr:tyrosine-protein phosphatase non-receptor type 23-like [Tropilaelaps mercedesae]
MEAAPRLQMLCFDLKISPKQAEFAHPLKKFIAAFYHEDPSNYSKAIQNLEQLRVAACTTSKDFAGVEVLKRYYSQLRSLQNRFPMTDDGAACVAFMWTDLYSGRVFNIADVKYELSSILYNIGALHSHLGALEDRTGAEGMKTACSHFQNAAWAFQHNRDSYPQPKGCDLSHDLLTFYSLVMLAQSQECILEKSLLDNRKSTISAKIAAQIVDFYAKAMNHLTADIKDIVGLKIYLQWKRICEMKASYYGAIAALHMGMGAEEERAYGLRVAWFREAMRRLTESLHAARDLSIDDTLAFTVDVIGGKLDAAEKENDFVYHDKVPAPENLPEVKGATLVKGIPFDPCDPEVSGPDLFASLIPMGAHEASSVYSEKKTQILRRVSELVEEKNAELATYESSLNLDKNILNTMLVKPTLPPDIIECCARFHTRRTAVLDLTTQLAKLQKMADDIAGLLREAEAQLKESRPGGVTSNVIADLRAELNKYREIHQHSSRSNDTLRDALRAHDEKLALLQYIPDILQQKLPHVIEATTEDAKVINELIRLFDKVDEMKAQRHKLFNNLREAIRNDDITKLIVANAQEDLNAVFDKAIAKHEQAIVVLEKNLSAQDNILKAVTEANASAAEVRLNLQQARQPWNTAIEGLRASAKAFEEVETQTLKGLDFFDKFQGNVSKLVTRLKSVVQVEREQEERLKMRQAAESAAAAAAAATAASTAMSANQHIPDTYMGHPGHSLSFNSGQTSVQPSPAASSFSGGQTAPKLKDYLTLMNKAKQGVNGAVNGSEYIPQPMPGSPGVSLPTMNATTATSAMGPATSLASGFYNSPQVSIQHQPVQQRYGQNAAQIIGSTPNGQNLAKETPAPADVSSIAASSGASATVAGQAVMPSHGMQASGVFKMPLPAGHLPTPAQTSTPVASQPQTSTSSAVSRTAPQPSTFTAQQQSQFYSAYNINSLGYPLYGGASSYAAAYGAYAHLYATPQTSNATAGVIGNSATESAAPASTAASPATAQVKGITNIANYYNITPQSITDSTSVASNSYAYPAGYRYPVAAHNQQYAYPSGAYSAYQRPTSNDHALSQLDTSIVTHASTPVTDTSVTVSQATATSSAAAPTAVVALPTRTVAAECAAVPYGAYTTMAMSTHYTPQQLSYVTAYSHYYGQTAAASSGPPTATAATTSTATTPASIAVVSTTQSVPANSVSSAPYTYQSMYHWGGYGNLPQGASVASASGMYMTSGSSSLAHPNAQTSATTSASYNSQQYALYYQQYAHQQQQQQYGNDTQHPAVAASQNASELNASNVAADRVTQSAQATTEVTGPSTNAYVASTMGINPYASGVQRSTTNPANMYHQYPETGVSQTAPSAYVAQTQVNQPPQKSKTTIASNLLDETPQLSVVPGEAALANVLQPTIVSSSVSDSETKTEADLGRHAGDHVSISNGETAAAAKDGLAPVLSAERAQSTNTSPSTQVLADVTNKMDSLPTISTVFAEASQSNSTALPSSAAVDPKNDPQVAHDLKIMFDKLDDMMRTLRLETRWKEYLDIQEAEARTLKISVGRICSMKNRFPDIMPYDYNRVVLASSKDDYINASLVASCVEGEPNYIITQAPLAATLEDFWTMVWEQGVETILSLSSFQELSSQLFFPSEKGTTQNYGPFHVSVLSFNERGAGIFTERLLAINGPQGPTRNVILVHVTQWTREISHQIALAEHVLDLHHKQRRTYNRPIVIQCLGGCGRSGILAFALRWISHLRIGRIPSDVIPILRGLAHSRKLLLLEQDQLRACLEIALLSIRAESQSRGLVPTGPATVTALDQMDEKQRKGQALSAEERIIQDLMQGFQAKAKITKESFEKPRGLEAGAGIGDPSDPLSQLDALWSLKK